MEESVKVNIEIPFPSQLLANIAYNVLCVDEEPTRSRVIKTLAVDDCILKAEFKAPYAKQVRVAVTSFFDSLSLVADTINFTGPPKHTGYSYS